MSEMRNNKVPGKLWEIVLWYRPGRLDPLNGKYCIITGGGCWLLVIVKMTQKQVGSLADFCISSVGPLAEGPLAARTPSLMEQ